MHSMPPLEHPNQVIESKHDTQTLANKDAFEISPCPNYEETIQDFVVKIVANNKCRETFNQVIQCVNPLSRSTASIFAKLVQNKADMITLRGWNVIKSASNIDETTVICYLIEYTHYARTTLSTSPADKSKSNDGFRKKIFDKLNNDARLKLKLNALSLDVLSLIITCHFISSLSSVTDGFFRSLLSTYLPSYLLRFTMNGTHFIRLFDSVVYHSKHCEETSLLQQLFDGVAQHIEFSAHGHIAARHTASLYYDHLFPIEVIFYILKQMMSITLELPPSVESFIIHLTTYAMNKFVMTPPEISTQTQTKSNQINAEFICLMLTVYHQYNQKLPNLFMVRLYEICCDLFTHAGEGGALDICLLSDMIHALAKINHLNKFIAFIAGDKAEHVNRIFHQEIIKKSGINELNHMITSASAKNKNIEWIFNDEAFVNIKSAFVSITVEIAKQFTQQPQESTTLLSTCAKSMIKFDDKSKTLKRNSIFNSSEFEKLIWCFGFAKYRNDNFWKELYAKVKKLNSSEVNSDIITKFSWSIARVKSYLSKHKRDNLIHGPMIWCIKNCVELISIAKQSIITLFTLEQISTICWAISICGKPGTQIENNYNDRALKYYVKLFDHIVSNTWEIVDHTLAGKPQFYINILTAMLTYKDELLREEEIKHKLIEFVVHVLNQFNISERGETYMKSDPNIIDFLLHIAAEFRIHVVSNNNNNNNNNNGNDTGNQIPQQMIQQMNKMLQYLMQLNVDITAECAFSIACTLSRIPYNEQLIATKHKVLDFLCHLIIKESQKRSNNNQWVIPLDYTLGLCSAICTHTSADNPLPWDPNVIDLLLKSVKHYLYDEKDKWTENHFLLKNHLKYFIDKFDKSL